MLQFYLILRKVCFLHWHITQLSSFNACQTWLTETNFSFIIPPTQRPQDWSCFYKEQHSHQGRASFNEPIFFWFIPSLVIMLSNGVFFGEGGLSKIYSNQVQIGQISKQLWIIITTVIGNNLQIVPRQACKV